MENASIEVAAAGRRFVWNAGEDRAVLIEERNGGTVWSGSLLPAFEIVGQAGKETPDGGTAMTEGRCRYVKARLAGATKRADNVYSLTLRFGSYGQGTLECETTAWGLALRKLEVDWSEEAPIASLWFGTRRMTERERTRAPRLDQVYWPDWSSEGYCVPAAGSSPTHSYWRSWDMGNAALPLGSFGDAMGTPYAAAFPRPLYAAAMGGKHGWLAFGPGEIPDAPLTLRLQSLTGCLHLSYREDLWTPPNGKRREWNEPLRLAWGDTGYEALGNLYATFGPFEPKSSHHARSFICTWGDFKEGRFDLKRYKERISGCLAADMVILDDCWETYNGSGEPDMERFPDFEADLEGLRASGYDIAIWQSLGWTDDPVRSGLAAEDLICGPDGVPRQWRWSGSPLGEGGYHYLLDPSSERTRSLIVERTQRLVRRWRPAALKLDFGYGYPGPDAGVPRDPAYRGERLAHAVLKLAYDAAKAIDPSITIIYYGVHPLFQDVTDLINLDDLGDAGDSPAHEIAGHNQRCLWASLAAAHGVPVNTSAGYYWEPLSSILLDTAVVGSNGLTIGEIDGEGKRVSEADVQRWAALQAWRRRTCGWKPVWLEADTGSLKGEPKLVSWGRLEADATDGDSEALTAVALRGYGSGAAKQYAGVPYVRFTGRWALISQDGADLASSKRVACIPFSAGTLIWSGPPRSLRAYGSAGGRLSPIGGPGGYDADRSELRVDVAAAELDRLAGFLIERG